MNIDYSLTIKDRNYILKTFSAVLIHELITFLLMRNIDNTIYKFNQYIVTNLYINNYVNAKNKQLIITKFLVEIYIINDFKINTNSTEQNMGKNFKRGN